MKNTCFIIENFRKVVADLRKNFLHFLNNILKFKTSYLCGLILESKIENFGVILGQDYF